jgi:hypothetical protein
LDENLIIQDFNDLSCCGWRGEANKEGAKVHPSTAVCFSAGSQENQQSRGRSPGSRFKVRESHIILTAGYGTGFVNIQPYHSRATSSQSGADQLAIKRIMEKNSHLPILSPIFHPSFSSFFLLSISAVFF